MRKWILFFSIVWIGCGLKAQTELPSDSVRTPKANYKQYGDFIMDMNQFIMIPPKLPRFNFDLPNVTTDYSQLFRLDDRMTFSTGYVLSYSFSPFGYGSSTQSDYMRMSSFRLNDNLRFNLYGEYDANGRKIPKPSVFPWEKNDFKGGFELKTNNGHFGIRFEVQRKTNPYIPY